MRDNESFKKTLKESFGFIKNHPTFSMTFGYVYFTILGVTYSIRYFNEFGINIINYWSSTDYVFVLFKTPGIIFTLLILLLLLILFYFRTEYFVRSVLEKYKNHDFQKEHSMEIIRKGLLRTIMVIFVLKFRRILFFPLFFIAILIPFGYAYYSAKVQANKIKNKPENMIQINVKLNTLQGNDNDNFNIDLAHSNSEIDSLGKNKINLRLIGLTDNFSFFYNAELSCTHIISNSNIREMVIKVNDIKDENEIITIVSQDTFIIDSVEQN